MTAGSDLDLLIIYSADADTNGQAWFTRFTQRLIAGLSAETGEGRLYEVDMRLRPSGRAGPVATSVKAFESYQENQAWTWEHMALTRLRPIIGDPDLSKQVEDIATRIISSDNGPVRTTDILAMRRRLFREKPPSGPWDLKMRRGGLVDLEFITQHAILTAQVPQPLVPELTRAHRQLHETGEWSDATYNRMSEAFAFLQALQQVQRVAHEDGVTDPDHSNAIKDRFCRAVGEEDFEALVARLETVCGTISNIFAEKVGDIATET